MADRQAEILERVQRQGTVQVGRLAAEFGVSEVTIRRDLAELERRGLVVRYHGGAILPDALVPDISFREKAGTGEEQKRRIAAAAAALVPEGATVALGAGTTVAAVARALSGRRLTVVTNAVNIAWEFANRGECFLVMTGGVLRESSYALVGRAAERSLQEHFVDIAFVGVNGISPVYGFTTPDPEEASIHQRMLARARRAVVVADAGKWGRVAFARIADLNQVHTVITDGAAPPDLIAELRQAGVEVILA